MAATRARRGGIRAAAADERPVLRHFSRGVGPAPACAWRRGHRLRGLPDDDRCRPVPARLHRNCVRRCAGQRLQPDSQQALWTPVHPAVRTLPGDNRQKARMGRTDIPALGALGDHPGAPDSGHADRPFRDFGNSWGTLPSFHAVRSCLRLDLGGHFSRTWEAPRSSSSEPICSDSSPFGPLAGAGFDLGRYRVSGI